MINKTGIPKMIQVCAELLEVKDFTFSTRITSVMSISKVYARMSCLYVLLIKMEF